jgi:hypothetical protein
MGPGSGQTDMDEAWESKVGVIGRLGEGEGDRWVRPGKKVLEPARGAIFQSFLTRHAR